MTQLLRTNTKKTASSRIPDGARASWFKAKAKRPLSLAQGRWIGDFGKLTAAECKLVRDCGRGVYCGFGENCLEVEAFPSATAHRDALFEQVARPTGKQPNNTIRASLLRFLILGGDSDHPLHEGGVQLVGAWIEGELDLSVSQGAGYLGFYNCHFDSPVCLDYARLPLIVFTGSFMPQFSGVCLRLDGDAYLNEKFETTSGVNLFGACIGGSLLCNGAILRCVDDDGKPSGIALDAALAQITGNVSLCQDFLATGEVRLVSAQIGGLLSLDNATLEGHVGGGLEFTGALNAEGVSVKGGLIVRKSSFNGIVNLLDAFASSLTDDQSSWPAGSLILDGFRYDRISFGSTDAVERCEWLRKQQSGDLGVDFRPQPWEHLIKVLRDMGHPNQAKLVAIEKQRALRRAGKIGPRPSRPKFDHGFDLAYNLQQAADWIAFPADLFGSWIRRVGHIGYGFFSGYGHRAFRIVGLIFAVLAAFGFAYRYFGVESPACLINGHSPSSCQDFWLPWRYSADMILPLDFGLFDKGQPVAASVGVHDPGDRQLVIFMSWVETLFGWLFSGLLVAIAGRLVERD